MGRSVGRSFFRSPLFPLIAAGALGACSNGGGNHATPTFFGARVITPQTAAADLFDDDPRSAALGRPGDVVMANDLIQVIIQAPGRDEGTGPQGGTIIDAGLRRAPGRVHLDSWGELTPMFQLGMTAITDDVEVETDGGRDGPSVVVARGPAGLLDLVDLQGLLYAEVRGLVDPPIADLLVGILEDGFPGLIGGIRRLSPRVDVDLTVETRYMLRPGERFVTVETTLVNPMDQDFVTAAGDLMDGRGKLEQFVPGTIADSPGFGEPGAITDNLDWVGYFGDEVAYAYVPPRDAVTGEVNSVYVGASGGVGIGTGARRFIEDVVLAPPDFSNSDVDPLVVPAHGQASFTRWFVVGKGGVSSVSDVVYDLQGIATGTARGRVTEMGSGAPLKNVRVTALRDGDFGRATTQFLTDEGGRFEGKLPAGDYGLIAAQGPSPQDDVRPSILDPVMIHVDAGGAVERDLTLGAPARVDVEIWDLTDGKPAPIPGRVSFVGADPTPPTRALMDDGGHGDLAYAEVVMGARRGLEVEPGSYHVVVSRGPEYDTYEEDRTLVAGVNSPIVANLTRVLDTAGYVSADLHVHQLRSPDSQTTDEDRLRLFAAENIEVQVATDHDTVSDLNPVLRRLGLEPYLVTLSGEEVSPLTYAHTNVFPLKRSDRNRLGGAIEHTSVKALPPEVHVSGEDRSLPDD
ncbi:MAG: hypothetical protein KC466_16505, partial [Myxococcales bacterium]|nr:hypothetical protein [Myxococcales bacterium]